MDKLTNAASADPLRAVPDRFGAAIAALQRLADHDRYQAAFIFGSVARGDSTSFSDLDVKVIVDQGNPCININHPLIDGVKLDLTFVSFEQIQATTQGEITRAERIPMLAESLILFDKTGKLQALRSHAQHAQPRQCAPTDHQLIRFLVYHADNKAKRFVHSDPCAALLVMHMSLSEILDNHYWIQGRWRVSSKRLLQDMRDWDHTLAHLLEAFVTATEVHTKYRVWTEVIDHVLQPLGGRQPIADNNCCCDVCRSDLTRLASPAQAIEP